MSYLKEADLGEGFLPFAILQERFGFIPQLFRAQSLLPQTIEAEVALLEAVLFSHRALSRLQKECILLLSAGAQGNAGGVALHYQMLRLLAVPEQRLNQIIAGYQTANLSPVNSALIDFALKLSSNGASVSPADVHGLRQHGLPDDAVLEVVLTAGLSNFNCTLTAGLGAGPDFSPREFPVMELPAAAEARFFARGLQPFLNTPELNDFEPFRFLRERFGFVPRLFQAQTLRPDVIEAEVHLMRSVLRQEGPLTPGQQAAILHGEPTAMLSPSDQALLDFAGHLAEQSASFGRGAIEALRAHNFTDPEILHTVVLTSLARFLRTLQFGLGAATDFRLRDFETAGSKKLHLSISQPRPTGVSPSVDPDAELVARVQRGDLDAFGELMNRHSQRVYRTLIGLLGDPEEARDAMQDTFLKVFQYLRTFEGRSRFSTWLVSIACNTGVQRLRERRPVESLDVSGFESEEGFRPRQIQVWTDDPEQLYSRTEMRALIEDHILTLPARYRVVVMLRDIEHVSTEEAAAALGLGIPALKARLLRGRLMLREALAPYFVASPSPGRAKGVTS